MQFEKFFWLHIKKSAGLATAELLRPHYLKLAASTRVRRPRNFIQSAPDEYNDILNNYRVVLGDYQFRRCLFAKKFLYKHQWDKYYSFAFSREPVDRCISMFFYLFWDDPGLIKYKQFVRLYIQLRKVIVSRSYAFDVFLDTVAAAQESESMYSPIDAQFTTHTAPMWADITDLDGNVLLKQVYRLEDLIDGINHVFEICGIDDRRDEVRNKFHFNKARKSFSPTRNQIRKIEELYSSDFEIYEGLAYRF